MENVEDWSSDEVKLRRRAATAPVGAWMFVGAYSQASDVPGSVAFGGKQTSFSRRIMRASSFSDEDLLPRTPFYQLSNRKRVPHRW